MALNEVENRKSSNLDFYWFKHSAFLHFGGRLQKGWGGGSIDYPAHAPYIITSDRG